MIKREIWKTVTLGLHTSPAAYLSALKPKFTVNDVARAMMMDKSFTTAKTVHDVDLVMVTPKDCGFTESVSRHKFYERAFKEGFELCPSEVGPALRLLLNEDCDVVIAMVPLFDSSETVDWCSLKQFSLRNTDVRRDKPMALLGEVYTDTEIWVNNAQTVFQIKKSNC